MAIEQNVFFYFWTKRVLCVIFFIDFFFFFSQYQRRIWLYSITISCMVLLSNSTRGQQAKLIFSTRWKSSSMIFWLIFDEVLSVWWIFLLIKINEKKIIIEFIQKHFTQTDFIHIKDWFDRVARKCSSELIYVYLFIKDLVHMLCKQDERVTLAQWMNRFVFFMMWSSSDLVLSDAHSHKNSWRFNYVNGFSKRISYEKMHMIYRFSKRIWRAFLDVRYFFDLYARLKE
jgi:hypothetical protein